MRVALIDGGICAKHRDLAGAIDIAARDNTIGIAPEATIGGVKALQKQLEKSAVPVDQHQSAFYGNGHINARNAVAN